VQKYTGGHGYEVLDLAVSQDNTSFSSVGGDKLVFLWDVATARTLRRWEGHSARVNAVRFAGEGDGVLVSGSYDATVKMWDCKGQGYKAVMSLGEARDSVSSVVVVGWEVLAGSVDGRVRTYDVRMGRCVVDVVGWAVTALARTGDGAAVLVSTLDSRLRLFDRRDGKLLQAFGDEGFVNDSYRVRAALGMKDSVVVSGSEDGSIFVWDLLEGKVLHRLSHASSDEDAAS
jgi:mitogen-activated protein kinase organizer 1